MKTDVWDLPDAQLKNSKTWRNNVDQCGSCTRCGEHAGLLDYCCSGNFYFEGGTVDSSELWQEIEDELDQDAKDKAEELAESKATGN